MHILDDYIELEKSLDYFFSIHDINMNNRFMVLAKMWCDWNLINKSTNNRDVIWNWQVMILAKLLMHISNCAMLNCDINLKFDYSCSY